MNKILIALVLAVVMSGSVFADNNTLRLLCSYGLPEKDKDKAGYPIGKPALPIHHTNFIIIEKNNSTVINTESDITGEITQYEMKADFQSYYIDLYFLEENGKKKLRPFYSINRKTLKVDFPEYIEGYSKFRRKPAPCWVEEKDEGLDKFIENSNVKSSLYSKSLKF
jgi:hypothetical protein